MAWSNNHLPKYRKHRSSGQAVVTLNGRDFYLGPHGTKASKRQYDRLLGEWLQNNRSPFVQPEDNITVVELCARYWPFAKGYYQKDGVCTQEAPNIRLALRLLREWYGKSTASEFGPLALKALRQRMIDENHSRRYVNAQVGRIKRMFKWAVAEELIPASISQSLAAVAGLRVGRSTMVWLTRLCLFCLKLSLIWCDYSDLRACGLRKCAFCGLVIWIALLMSGFSAQVLIRPNTMGGVDWYHSDLKLRQFYCVTWQGTHNFGVFAHATVKRREGPYNTNQGRHRCHLATGLARISRRSPDGKRERATIPMVTAEPFIVPATRRSRIRSWDPSFVTT